MRRGPQRLTKSLVASPLLTLILAMVMTVVVFNVVVSFFVHQQTQQSVNHQFRRLDAYYAGRQPLSQETDGVFDATYMIVDQNFEVFYQSTSLDDEAGRMLSDQLATYVRDHDESDWEEDEGDWELELDLDEDHLRRRQRVTLSGQTYEVKTAQYHGVFDRFYVRASNETAAATYTVLVFVNISPIEEAVTWMNLLLVVILLVVGGLAGLVNLLTAKRLDKAFARLHAYILAQGRREELDQSPQLPYQEFQELVGTVERMTSMIDANQRSQQVFFQNASHELRTPLMSIQGYAEGIKTGVIKDSQAAAAIIQTESQKMAGLVTDILQLSQLEGNTASLKKEEVVLQDLLYDLTWRLKPEADQAGLIIAHDFPSQPLTGLVDEVLLERAVGNIISNALRYALTRIEVGLAQTADGVAITIANDGPAIAPADQERIFDRFYKGHGGQSGLGLAISRDLVARHGGQLTVESDEQETVFRLTLPSL